jgi:glycerophosphoryl diester phosphodiesterase
VDNPWLERRVLNYAHQGGAREAPSSTMHSFHQAIEKGATGLEMDVHLTADDVLVVCHDETIDRTTQLTGRIDELTYEQLLQADNAYWWAPGHQAIHDLAEYEYPLRGRAPEDTACGVARLTEVLDAFPDVYLNFDIKGGRAPYEARLAETLRAYDRSTDVIVASFSDVSLQRFRNLAPEIHTSSALQESWDIALSLPRAGAPFNASSSVHVPIPDGVVAMQIPFRLEPGGAALFDADLVERIHQVGLALHVWTIDDPQEMQVLLDLGVDAIITDVPSVLTKVLAKHALA